MSDRGQMTSLPAAAGLVPIEEGRAHARTVLTGDGVRFVVLAIAAGAGLKEHRTPKHPLLMQALDGEVKVTVDGRDTLLRPGDFLHVDAGVPHAVHAGVDSHLGLLLLNAGGER